MGPFVPADFTDTRADGGRIIVDAEVLEALVDEGEHARPVRPSRRLLRVL
jgi:hypothetical protein